MANFEVVVRPVVFPNIRPAPARVLPRENDPEKGFAVIRGNPATHIDLPYSYSMNATSSRSVETEREVDTVRVYQEEDDGTINRDNFVDIEIPHKIKKKGASGPAATSKAEKETFGDQSISRPQRWVERFKRAEEKRNVEIQERDQIRKNDDESEQWSKRD